MKVFFPDSYDQNCATLLSRKVTGWLDENDRSIAWLAREVGCSSSTVFRALNGSSMPSFSLTCRIASVCTIDLNLIASKSR